MGHTLEQFAAKCHRILKANPRPTGRQQVCTRLQEVLKDESFLQGSELRVIQRELELESAIGHGGPAGVRGQSPDPRPRQSPHRLLPAWRCACIRMWDSIIA